jgi:Putative zinc-finger
MKFSQEVLMAYADGELDAETRAAVEAAMAEDPAIAAEIARHRALRDRLRGAFAGVTDEIVPSRLIHAANTAPTAAKPATRVRWSWPEWTSIAASLLIGVIGGRALLQSGSSNLIATDAGHVIAAGALASALSTEISGAPDMIDRVKVGLSYRAKDGNYCRTFALPKESSAGVACRDAQQWQILALARDEATGSTEYRQAASMPPAIAALVEDTIEGEALDAEQEAVARGRDWAAPRQ